LNGGLLLRAEIEELRERLSLCQKERVRLKKELEGLTRRKEGLLGLIEEKSRIEGRMKLAGKLARANRKALERTEARVEGLEERLKRCIRRRRGWRIWRMAYLAGLGMEKGAFSPGRMARDTGMRYWKVYRDIRLLQKLGILRRVRWGVYRVKAGVRGEDLEDEIAKSLAAGPDTRRRK
jgi:hypothetical protein